MEQQRATTNFMNIRIRNIIDEIVLEVDPSDTIEQVKQKIKEKRFDVPLDQIRLLYGGKLLKDDKTLLECDINGEEILDLILKLSNQIYVKTPSGQALTIEVDHNNTIENIKTIIEKLEGTLAAKQRLELDGKIMEDKLSLNDYNIDKDSIITMAVNNDTASFTIRVKNYSQTFFLEMHPTDTVLDIKKKIFKSQDVETDVQRIILKGKDLSNDATMADHNIQHDDLLWLMLDLSKVLLIVNINM